MKKKDAGRGLASFPFFQRAPQRHTRPMRCPYETTISKRTPLVVGPLVPLVPATKRESIQCSLSSIVWERNADASPSPNSAVPHPTKVGTSCAGSPKAIVTSEDTTTGEGRHHNHPSWWRGGRPYLKSKCNGRDALVGERRARSRFGSVPFFHQSF